MNRYITTEQELESVVRDELTPYLQDKKAILALDIETYTTDLSDDVPRPVLLKDGSVTGQIRTIQIGLDPSRPISLDGKQFIIDVVKIGYPALTKHLKKVLESAVILGHNLKYDYGFLYLLLNIELKRMIDTMLIGQVYFAGDIKNHSLVDVYSYLFFSKDKLGWFKASTGVSPVEYREFKKSQQSADWSKELTEDNLKYAAQDVFFIFYCLEEFKYRISNWEKVYEKNFNKGSGIRSVLKLEFNLIPVYSLMELRGIHFDVDYHRNYVIKSLELEKEESAENCSVLTRTYTVEKGVGRGKNRVKWTETITEPININSPIQLKAALEDLLSSDFCKKIVVESTAEDILKRYLNDPELNIHLSKFTKDILKEILRFKKASSLLSKFGEKMIDATTDRGFIHPSWLQCGSDDGSISSGRSSCRNPNLQQQVSRGLLFDKYDAADFFRSAFNADVGYKIVCADYSQIEARLAALICKDTNLVERFNSGNIDIYGAIAKAMMDLDYEPNKESEDENERYLRNYIGKTAGLSLLYGTHWRSLSQWMFDKTEGKVKWDAKESEVAYNNFFKNFPQFKSAMFNNREKVKRLPEEAGETLFPFVKRNKLGEQIPFHVAFSSTGIRRPRRFVLKPDYLKKDEFQLSSKAPRREDENGNLRSNIYNERISSASREGFNHQIQSTAANILKYAAYLVHHEFIKAGFHWQEGIVALIHDEILCHVKEENVEKAKEIVSSCMKLAGEEMAPGLVFNVKPKSADTWAGAK